jgi:hypothetical protein
VERICDFLAGAGVLVNELAARGLFMNLRAQTSGA